jgi:tetraacyldisaccharide 4'-kinase
LPSGLRREPLSAARAADAVLVYGTAEEAGRIASQVAVPRVVLRDESPPCVAVASGDGSRREDAIGAVAGIARPQRFFDALRRDGRQIVREFTFPDHHWFTAAELQEVERQAKEAGR